MSDRSYAQVIVYDCPEDQRAEAHAAIYEAFGSEGINEHPSVDTMPESENVMAHGRFVPAEELVLGDRYGDDECSLDMNETIADALIEAAPGATFAAWVDPKYEYAGALTAYTPALGRFDAACDADGNTTITGATVRRLMADSTHDLRDALRAALGLAWDEAIDAAARSRTEAGAAASVEA